MVSYRTDKSKPPLQLARLSPLQNLQLREWIRCRCPSDAIGPGPLVAR